jgi:hypothetical protein
VGYDVQPRVVGKVQITKLTKVKHLDSINTELAARRIKKPLPPLDTSTSKRPHLRDAIVFQNECAMETNYLLLAMKFYSNTAATEMEDGVMGPLPLYVLAAQYPIHMQPEMLPHKVPLTLDPLKILVQFCPSQVVATASRANVGTGHRSCLACGSGTKSAGLE